jgi:hypothetical protein
VKTFHEIRMSYRPMIRSSYFLQAGHAVLSAFCLYMAIYFFFDQSFFWSAMQTCVAFFSGHQFIGIADHRRRMQAEVSHLRKLEALDD